MTNASQATESCSVLTDQIPKPLDETSQLNDSEFDSSLSSTTSERLNTHGTWTLSAFRR